MDKLSYELHAVRRGNVVVFARPPTLHDTTVHDLIKRAIGLPGEHIAVHDRHVYIDGRELVEPYTRGRPTDFSRCTPFSLDMETPAGMMVPDGSVLVLGDNRTGSEDGRCFGPIAKGLIVGRASAIIWPPGHIASL